MNCFALQATEHEIFQICNKKCGLITTSEDRQYFSLNCLFCTEKFLYFDAFINHTQTDHAILHKGSYDGSYYGSKSSDCNALPTVMGTVEEPRLLAPEMVMVKEERTEEVNPVDGVITGMHNERDLANHMPQVVKNENYSGLEMPSSNASGASETWDNDESYESDDNYVDENGEQMNEDYNDDDLLEEALLEKSDLTVHIKDRNMIQFLIDSYKNNPFLWDHHHPKYRCRLKRTQFLNMIVNEFKHRFNITIARDAITRKWDNLRTVYKRECNRMMKENTNVSTLWYFKELDFLNFVCGGNQQFSEPVIKEVAYRRRFSSLWNEESTSKLLYLVSQYPCFWDKYNVDYRSKERRGEALQYIVSELQTLLQVSPIQISKRMSQLRLDYSKQKQERFVCEQTNKPFVPSFTYYDQMQFMDHDILPFKCDFCGVISNTTRDSEIHMEVHNLNHGSYVCSVCHMTFNEVEQFYSHKRTHLVKELKYHCEMCSASFKDKTNFNEHLRRHGTNMPNPDQMRFYCNECAKRFHTSLELRNHMRMHMNVKPYVCDICGKPFASNNHLISHRSMHTEEGRSFKCDYAQCCKTFASRDEMMEHMKLHFCDEEHKCDICGKLFKSTKNLQNHKQIHDAIKKYVCKICGSAFAQAAGLYLHKRRHNRQPALQHKQVKLNEANFS